MAVTTQVPSLLFRSLASGQVTYLTDDVVLILADSSFVFDQDADRFLGDTNISGTEMPNSGGYTTGGESLTTKSFGLVTGTNRGQLFSDPVAWAGSTISGARYAIVADNEGASYATAPILSVINFGEDKSTSASDFTVTAAADGWLYGAAT